MDNKKLLAVGFVLGGIGLALKALFPAKAEAIAPPPPPPAGKANLYGSVAEENGPAVAGAAVILGDEEGVTTIANVATDSNGTFQFLDLEPGTYSVTVSKDGYTSSSNSVSVDEGNNQLDVALVPMGTTAGPVIRYIFPIIPDVGCSNPPCNRTWKFTTIINDWTKLARVADPNDMASVDWRKGYTAYYIDVPIPVIAPPSAPFVGVIVGTVTATLEGDYGVPGGPPITDYAEFYAWTPGELKLFVNDPGYFSGADTLLKKDWS